MAVHHRDRRRAGTAAGAGHEGGPGHLPRPFSLCRCAGVRARARRSSCHSRADASRPGIIVYRTEGLGFFASKRLFTLHPLRSCFVRKSILAHCGGARPHQLGQSTFVRWKKYGGISRAGSTKCFSPLRRTSGGAFWSLARWCLRVNSAPWVPLALVCSHRRLRQRSLSGTETTFWFLALMVGANLAYSARLRRIAEDKDALCAPTFIAIAIAAGFACAGGSNFGLSQRVLGKRAHLCRCSSCPAHVRDSFQR